MERGLNTTMPAGAPPVSDAPLVFDTRNGIKYAHGIEQK